MLLSMQFNIVTGLEALEKALYCWEDALSAFNSTLNNDTFALPSKADAAFTKDVQELLDLGYQIQSTAELLFIDQVTFGLNLKLFIFRYLKIKLNKTWFLIANLTNRSGMSQERILVNGFRHSGRVDSLTQSLTTSRVQAYIFGLHPNFSLNTFTIEK